MEQYLRKALKALWSGRAFIAGVTAALLVLAVIRELFFGASYVADAILVVTNLNARGDTAELVPSPFNPKIYEQLILSSAALGEVRDELERREVYRRGRAPSLESLRLMLSADVSTVDETTRPVNYSPLIRLVGRADTAARAAGLVDAWAEVAQRHAARAVELRLAGVSGTLALQRTQYSDELESIWEAIESETGVWNLGVLKEQLAARVELLVALEEAKTQNARELDINRHRLKTIQEDLLNRVAEEQNSYRETLDETWDQLILEQSAHNTDLLQRELEAQQLHLRDLLQKRATLERDLEGARERLASVDASLETEEPFLELGRAPADSAYWIVRGEGGARALRDLETKVMVSQELNQVYWTLKRERQDVLGIIAARQAELAAIDRQMTQTETAQAETQKIFAAQEVAQEKLRMDINAGRQRYDKVAASVVLALMDEQRAAMLEIAQRDASLRSLREQIAAIDEERRSLQRDIAERSRIQTRLRKEEEIAASVFGDIARSASFVNAAATLSAGQTGIQPVGLNRVSDATYAVRDTGTFGRKGRVAAALVLGVLLSAAFLVLRDVALPELQQLVE